MSLEQDLINMLHPPMPEGKEHLVYRDFPKMIKPLFDWFLEQLEPYELEVLTYAEYEHDGVKLARGQVFVHPDGLANLAVAYERDEAKILEWFPKKEVDAPSESD